MWCNQNKYLNIIPGNKIELSTSLICGAIKSGTLNVNLDMVWCLLGWPFILVYMWPFIHAQIYYSISTSVTCLWLEV